MKISLADALMSGFAVFSLKDPSLLAFDERRKDETKLENLKRIYHIDAVEPLNGTIQKSPAMSGVLSPRCWSTAFPM